MVMGRPTKYRKEYCEKLEHLLSIGKFVVTFCAEVDIAEVTFYEWIKKHEDFAKAYDRGKAKGRALFMERIADHAWQPAQSVNNTLISLLGVNVYGLRTKAKEDEEQETPPPVKVEIVHKPAGEKPE